MLYVQGQGRHRLPVSLCSTKEVIAEEPAHFHEHWCVQVTSTSRPYLGAVLGPLLFLVHLPNNMLVDKFVPALACCMPNASDAMFTQGVVTSIPPVDTLATGIKNFDRRNFALIA